jgi:hypothetical protein
MDTILKDLKELGLNKQITPDQFFYEARNIQRLCTYAAASKNSSQIMPGRLEVNQYTSNYWGAKFQELINTRVTIYENVKKFLVFIMKEPAKWLDGFVTMS